jgi:hypothetical protein
MDMQAPGLDACRTATYSDSDVFLDTVPAGKWFCVKTSDGHWAELRLKQLLDGSRGAVLFVFVWLNTLQQ